MNDEMKAPFAVSDIQWLPGSMTKAKDKCLALAYADLRAYQNRLDDIFGMDWSVNYTPWGDRIICNLTLSGVTRSSTGEMDQRSEKSEIGGTVAEAQAFKRACAMFGLGRYLYSLPQQWVACDEYGKITAPAKRSLDDMYVRHTAQLAQAAAAHRNGTQPANHTATHRNAPQSPAAQPTQTPPLTDDKNFYDPGAEWEDMGREADANLAAEKKAAAPFVWPTAEDEQGFMICTGLANNPDLPKRAFDMISYFIGLDGGSGRRALSERQYPFLAGLIDKRYNGGHNAILSALVGKVVDSDCIPGWKIKELIDWLKEPEANAGKLEVLDQLVEFLKQDISQFELA